MTRSSRVDEKSRWSYTAANVMPWKLLRNDGYVMNGVILPVHLQLVPTNRCNQRCPWCSCSRVDRTLEMPIGEIKTVLSRFASMGTRAVTITGGGEPTLHPHIEDAICHARKHSIEVGIATNGILWGRSGADLARMNEALTWVRMSVTDVFGPAPEERIVNLCRNLPDVDIGISFTVVKGVNVKTAIDVCRIADETGNLTHVRFVQDVFELDNESMCQVVDECQGITSKAIFQFREIFKPGAKRCLVSKLRPFVDVTGLVYPCCGVQEADPDDERRLPERFIMGHWMDFDRMKPFDGSLCRKCYYDRYNRVLENMVEPLRHERFL